MQRAPFFELLSHTAAAAATVEDFKARGGDYASVFNGVGVDFARGKALVDVGEQIIEDRITGYVDDRNLEHAVHVSTHELEMWLQTVKFRLKKGGLKPGLIDDALGKKIHTHNHTVSALAQAHRFIGMARTNSKIAEAIGSPQSVHDLMLRGLTLTKKLYKVADYLSRPTSIVPKSRPIHARIQTSMREMNAWLAQLNVALIKLNKPPLAGLLGWVPDGMGTPLGGAGRNITLHENAQRAAPDPSEAKTTSGWSVGRQGNRENVGQGWTPDDVTSL